MISLLVLWAGAAGQDLIERSTGHAPADPPPAPQAEEAGTVPKGRWIPFADDVGAAGLEPEQVLAPLLQEDGRLMEILLKEAEKTLPNHALTLLCQASPTLCNVFKHVRANLNAARAELLELVRSIENKAPGVEIISRSEILRDCLREEIRKGTPPGRALRACLSRDRLKNMFGEWVRRIDLVDELARWLGLNPQEARVLRKLLRPVRITAKGLEIGDGASPVEKRFREKFRGWYEQLRRILHRPSKLSRKVADRLLGFGITPEEIGRISAGGWVADRTLRTLARVLAELETGEEVSRVEGYLLRVEASAGVRAYIRFPVRQLREENRAEMDRLRREIEMSVRMHRALTALREDIDRGLAERIFQRLNSLQRSAEAEAFRRDLGVWGVRR